MKANQSTIERRLEALEGDVAKLKRAPQKAWWQAIYGSFANDPAFEEAMRLGRAYRNSTRRSRTSARNVHP